MPCVVGLALYHLLEHVLLGLILLCLYDVTIADILDVVVLEWLWGVGH